MTVFMAWYRREWRVSISRTRAAAGSSACVLPREPADDRRQHDHRDVAVDVEEGHLEAGEVARAHERVLVDEQRHHPEPAHPVERTQSQHPPPQREPPPGPNVADPRGAEAGPDPGTPGPGVH